MLIANKSCDFYYRSCNTKYPLVSNHTSAQLDGMVWPSQSQTEPGGRNGAGPSANQQQSRQVLLCKFDIHNFIFHYIYIYIHGDVMPRPWAGKLYQKLTKRDKRKLGLTSKGVVKRKAKADGSVSVPRP